MIQHAPDMELELLRVYQRFHGYTSSSGAEFTPCKMLHDILPVKYLWVSSQGELSELENAPSCVLTRAKMSLENASGAKPLGVSAFKCWEARPKHTRIGRFTVRKSKRFR